VTFTTRGWGGIGAIAIATALCGIGGNGDGRQEGGPRYAAGQLQRGPARGRSPVTIPLRRRLLIGDVVTAGEPARTAAGQIGHLQHHAVPSTWLLRWFRVSSGMSKRSSHGGVVIGSVRLCSAAAINVISSTLRCSA
jgi:hypothetical protein